jgi:hypothetical protein
VRHFGGDDPQFRFILNLFHYEYSSILLLPPDPASTLAPNTRYRLSHIHAILMTPMTTLMTLYLIPQPTMSSRSGTKTIAPS